MPTLHTYIGDKASGQRAYRYLHKCALIYPMALDVIASTPWLMDRILAALSPNVGT